MVISWYLFGDRNITSNQAMYRLQQNIINQINKKTNTFYNSNQLQTFIKAYIKSHYSLTTKLTPRNKNNIINGTVKSIEQNRQKQFLKVASQPLSNRNSLRNVFNNQLRNVVLIPGGPLAGIGVERI
jgi:hypothetical protein